MAKNQRLKAFVLLVMLTCKSIPTSLIVSQSTKWVKLSLDVALEYFQINLLLMLKIFSL